MPPATTFLSALAPELLLLVLSFLSLDDVLTVGRVNHKFNALAQQSVCTLQLSIQPTRIAALTSLLLHSDIGVAETVRKAGLDAQPRRIASKRAKWSRFEDEADKRTRSKRMSPRGIAPMRTYLDETIETMSTEDGCDCTLLTAASTTAHKSRRGNSTTAISSKSAFTKGATNDMYNASIHLIPQHRQHSLQQILHYQADLSTTLITRYTSTLRTLTLDIWELDPTTALAITTLSRLRHLALRLDHPCARHRDISRTYWETPRPRIQQHPLVGDEPGYTNPSEDPWSIQCWDALCDPGDRFSTGVFGTLEVLELSRASITGIQLARLVLLNPRLREIKLRKCAYVGRVFWLALVTSAAAARSHACSRTRNGLDLHHHLDGSHSFESSLSYRRQPLQTLCFTETSNPEIDDGVLDAISSLCNGGHNLKTLSLQGCKNISSESTIHLNNESWHIPRLIPPRPLPQDDMAPLSPSSSSSLSSTAIEVDPDYV